MDEDVNKQQHHEILFVPVKEDVRCDLWEEYGKQRPISNSTSVCTEEVKEEITIEEHTLDSAYAATPRFDDPLCEVGKEYVQGQDSKSSNFLNHSSNFLQETSIVLGTEDLDHDHAEKSNCTSDTGGSRDANAVGAQDNVFSCTKCSAKFISSFILEHHMQTHTGFFCKVCCAKFKYRGGLKHHLRKHTGETPYSCTVCPAKFRYHSSRSKHMALHMDEKPFSCTVCPARFRQNATRNKHLLTHAGKTNMPYLFIVITEGGTI